MVAKEYSDKLSSQKCLIGVATLSLQTSISDRVVSKSKLPKAISRLFQLVYTSKTCHRPDNDKPAVFNGTVKKMAEEL